MVTGDNMAYIGATGGRPIPLATDQRIRPAHAPQTKPKPTGLDWDALTPACSGCGQKSGQLGAGALCPTCRGVTPTPTPRAKVEKGKKKRRPEYAAPELPEDELLRRFTAPDDNRLAEDLADLEAPAVAPVSTVEQPEPEQPQPVDAAPDQQPVEDPIDEPEDHTPAYLRRLTTARNPEPVATVTDLPLQYSPEANLDAQVAHAERVLRASHGTTDPVARLLRLNAITAIEALHLHTELHHPTLAEPNPPGLGEASRPAARSLGEDGARPAAKRKRSSRLDPHRDDIVALYKAGTSPAQLGATYGTSDVTIRAFLTRAGVTLRNRSQAQLLNRRRKTPTSTGDATA